jgi:hypothetical protein
MRPHRCPPDRHEFADAPRNEYAGYQQTRDGRRIDGKWQTFVCQRCGHTTERWHAEGTDTEAAELNTAGAWAINEDVLAPPPPRSIWDRPLLLWLLAALVLAVALYGYYWDSRVRPSTVLPPQVIKPVPVEPPRP